MSKISIKSRRQTKILLSSVVAIGAVAATLAILYTLGNKELRTEIVINAPEERVWAILTDLDNYPNWNPFITEISGDLIEGEKLKFRIEHPNQARMDFTPTVLNMDENRELRWLGMVGSGGIFDGEHRFVIERIGENQVKFTQAERFTGILVPFFAQSLDTNLRQGFENMNQALKELAERSS